MSYTDKLVGGEYYHIYNRGINKQNLYFEPRNYDYFLNLYRKYIFPVVETYAYCLLPNHFHFQIRVKNPQDRQSLKDCRSYDPSQSLSNLFSTYSKAINKGYNRSGGLFERPFKRVHIKENSHLFKLVIYIHRNPQKYGLVNDFTGWPYSSYPEILENQASIVESDKVLNWFGGRENFICSHREKFDEATIASLVSE